MHFHVVVLLHPLSPVGSTRSNAGTSSTPSEKPSSRPTICVNEYTGKNNNNKSSSIEQPPPHPFPQPPSLLHVSLEAACRVHLHSCPTLRVRTSRPTRLTRA